MNSDDFVPFDSNKNELDGSNKKGVPSSSTFALPALITDVRAPWMQYCQSDTEGDFSSTTLVRLHNEILTFCEYIAPTKVSSSSLLSLQNSFFPRLNVLILYQVSAASSHSLILPIILASFPLFSVLLSLSFFWSKSNSSALFLLVIFEGRACSSGTGRQRNSTDNERNLVSYKCVSCFMYLYVYAYIHMYTLYVYKSYCEKWDLYADYDDNDASFFEFSCSEYHVRSDCRCSLLVVLCCLIAMLI